MSIPGKRRRRLGPKLGRRGQFVRMPRNTEQCTNLDGCAPVDHRDRLAGSPTATARCRASCSAPRWRRLAQTPLAPLWIARANEAQFEAQLAALEARAAAQPDRAAALRAMPLFGEPFAVKANIDIAGLPTSAACATKVFSMSNRRPDGSCARSTSGGSSGSTTCGWCLFSASPIRRNCCRARASTGARPRCAKSGCTRCTRRGCGRRAEGAA